MLHVAPRQTLLAAACTVALLGAAAPARADVADNPGYQDAYNAWAAAHLALLPTAFLPGPFGAVADLATIGIDIRLKYLPASFTAPGDKAFYPNAASGCELRFTQPRVEASYQNVFGFWDVVPLPTDWGAFGAPSVGHANAEVKVSVDAPFLDDWSPAAPFVNVPAGQHNPRWRADTQLDLVFDVVIPAALFIITAELKYGDAILKTDPKSAARALAIGKSFLGSAALEAGVVTGGTLFSPASVNAATHSQLQSFHVYDVHPPQITTSEPNPPPLEATDFGGERWQRHAARFRDTITATDPCGRPLTVGNDAPVLLPIGSNTVTWTAQDLAPLPPDGSNPGFDTVTQTIVVQDTLAPILLAPPSRVIESATTATPADVDIGTAVVFDLADPDPAIDNTSPASFPPNTRTEILWTATDGSGNSAQKSQWVTVKAPGSNTPPQVANVFADTLTGQPVDLTLSGSDNDFLSGRFDPLKFEITQPPQRGFFVAPLTPYFIEDFRVRPEGLVGEIINTSSNPPNDLYQQVCQQGEEIPRDFVYQPEFVHVADDGSQYVLDRYWDCGPSNASTYPRLSRWGIDGELLAQADVDASVKRITLDRDGFVYTVIPGTASDPLFLNKYDEQFNLLDLWKLDANTPYGSPPNRMLHARIDSDTGLIYATDKLRVYVYDGADGQEIPGYLGVLMDGDGFLSQEPAVAGSSSRGFYIEVDEEGALYVVDSGWDRVHKFQPSTWDGLTFTPGAQVGWLGRCESGPNCNDEEQRSIGYSCTDATCTVLEANGSNCGAFISGPCTHGSGPGQFDTPIGIALDPVGNLYVTDYDNARVQRFTPLGDFAGEAASTCDGRCFVLGDMGRPLDISVNADHFFVLDRDRDLMHVFETAPFKDITEDSVVVSYASDNDFQGTDSFRFRANDGLANSAQGTATIEVERNFRPPVAEDSSLMLAEDSPAALSLPASDPDGILGVDFNGLDTLTWQVVEPPQHGTLTGSGGTRTYSPDPDFHGSDWLMFTVSDGVFTSEPALVEITVAPVNDPPVVRLTDAQSKIVPKALWPLLEGKILKQQDTAGLGYPLPLMAEFDDPDPGQLHTLRIDWGDGSIDTADLSPPPDPESGHEGPVLTPAYLGTGQAVGEHAWTSTGSRTVQVCVRDDENVEACTSAAIEVVPMVDVTIEDATDRDPLAFPGNLVTMTVVVGNAAPVDPVVGLDASNVQASLAAPEGTTFMGVTSTVGSCAGDAASVACAIGTLVPDQAATLTVQLLVGGDFDAEQDALTVGAGADQPDPTGDNTTEIAIPVLPLLIFGDAFEE